jgi:hypothetical protein
MASQRWARRAVSLLVSCNALHAPGAAQFVAGVRYPLISLTWHRNSVGQRPKFFQGKDSNAVQHIIRQLQTSPAARGLVEQITPDEIVPKLEALV